MLALLVVIAPIVAAIAVARHGFARSFGFTGHPAFVIGVLPYLVLTALLPVLGVMLTGYPEPTLLSVTAATTAVSFLVLGALWSSSEEDGRRGSDARADGPSISGEHPWSRWLLAAIALQLVYAAGQAVYLSKGPGSQAVHPLSRLGPIRRGRPLASSSRRAAWVCTSIPTSSACGRGSRRSWPGRCCRRDGADWASRWRSSRSSSASRAEPASPSWRSWSSGCS